MIIPSQSEVVSILQKSGIVKKTGDGPTDLKSIRYNPMNRTMYRGSRNILEPNRGISYRILRTVAERAWIINAIIKHLVDSSRPFMKPSTDENVRGFRIRSKDVDTEMSEKEKSLAKSYEQFFMRTGFGDDPDREDSLTTFSAKAIRDLLTLDQLSTELQRTASQKVYAMWAIDPATVLKCTEEGYEGNDKIRYLQEVDMRVTAWYTRDDLIFDYMNPRTDIDHSGYGYSATEQAIDLVTGVINAFMYNMGVFTEDKLPRGVILLQGDADTEEVEMIEDYLINIMSGPPSSKWRVPIIPAGKSSLAGSERKLEWIKMQETNKDMEYGQWTEFIYSSVAAIFGVDLEAMGIRTSKSTAILGDNVTPRIEASKSRGLGSILGFLEQHYQKILDKMDPRFDFEFVGYEREDPDAKSKLRESDLRTYKSIDELRQADGLEPFEQKWSTIPLNPSVIQIMQMEQQEKMMQGQGQEGDPEQGEDPYRDLLIGDDANQDEGEEDQRSIYDEDEEESQDDNPKSIYDKDEEPAGSRQQIRKSLPIEIIV